LSDFFEGWYFKHQKDGRMLALIPGRSKDRAFVQVITNERAYNVDFPLDAFHKGDIVAIGENRFAADGICVNLHSENLDLSGELFYENLTPLVSDIMGPFRFFPMECRHTVVSMGHTVSGTLTLNGEKLYFDGGRGYIEGDSGKSFPKNYTWVQCNAFDEPCFVMASIARIPFAGLRFTGCICVVWVNGREHRLATYRGVRILHNTKGRIELHQRGLRLCIEVVERNGHKLLAPVRGLMRRSIHEIPLCKARFRFWENGALLFDLSNDCASFECVE